MDIAPSLEKAHAFTRQALPLMSRHGIPTTPVNYTIWYTYVTGENQPLKETLDQMIEKGAPFTDETARDIYERFCCDIDESNLIRLQDGISILLTALFSETHQFSGHTGSYERLLAKSMAVVKKSKAGETLGQVIQKIIEETKSIIVYSQTLQQKLQQTTQDLQTLKQDYEKAKKEASQDPLTGVFNRKAFMESAITVLNDSINMGTPVSLVFLDIDHFKNFNDTFGHMIGDEVLKFVARQIRQIIKGRDVLARMGGEEFAILLPDTGHDGALYVCEKIRTYFATHKLTSMSSSHELGNITLSIGLAVYRAGESLEDLINRSDQALYRAKTNGRNRTASEKDLL